MKFTEQALTLLGKHYAQRPDETPKDVFSRAAYAYASSPEHGARMLSYMLQSWFIPSSPIVSNAPLPGSKQHGLPIACYLLDVPDTIQGQKQKLLELAALSVAGGGVGMHNSIRAVSDKAPGPIPYMKVVDSMIGYFRQGRTRRGSLAYYMDVNHPDIVEHILFRKRHGGDAARKADNKKNFHCAVNITDDFMHAVLNNYPYYLVDPSNGAVVEQVQARDIWELILKTRAETGEPYLHFIDESNRQLPTALKAAGLRVRGSNLCSEITLATAPDYTAVCCLGSLNLEKFTEWHGTLCVQDCVEYLDNVLDAFINEVDNSDNEDLRRAATSARSERSIGLGTMGWHSFLQSKGIAFDSTGVDSAASWNYRVFKYIKDEAMVATRRLAAVRGEPLLLRGTGVRNAHLLAIAPNSNSSILADCSPSIEPLVGNVFTSTTRAGAHTVRNKYLYQAMKEKYPDKADDEAVWRDIEKHDGSVQHLKWLDAETKAVFKTAFEIDQHFVVEQAAVRQQFICQAQSLNLFFGAGADADYVNSVHLMAWKNKLKTLYYYRTENKQKFDTAKEIERRPLEEWASEECISCQA